MPLKLAIVTDIRIYREGLQLVLGERDDFRVVATAGDSLTAETLVRAQRPHAALVDMTMPDALGCVRRLSCLGEGTRVVALTLPEAEGQILSCAEAGVSAYATRDASLEELARAIQAAARGELQCTPRVAGALLRRVSTLAGEQSWRDDPARHLTAREQEIFGLLCEGRANKEIALALRIEVSTVKNHVHKILEKLGASSRGEAAALARGQRRLSASSLRGPTGSLQEPSPRI